MSAIESGTRAPVRVGTVIRRIASGSLRTAWPAPRYDRSGPGLPPCNSHNLVMCVAFAMNRRDRWRGAVAGLC
jgi:hypothetical protein